MSQRIWEGAGLLISLTNFIYAISLFKDFKFSCILTS